ncbi:MAG: DUF6404 family protein [Pseudomonadota bacterium]
MELTAKREAVLQLMQSKGIWKAGQAPMMLRALWRSGIDCPPPQMAAFGMCAFVFGSYFAIVMWMFHFLRTPENPIAGAIVGSVVGSTFFGLAMAACLRHVRLKHGLPLWRDFWPAN